MDSPKTLKKKYNLREFNVVIQRFDLSDFPEINQVASQGANNELSSQGNEEGDQKKNDVVVEDFSGENSEGSSGQSVCLGAKNEFSSQGNEGNGHKDINETSDTGEGSSSQNIPLLQNDSIDQVIDGNEQGTHEENVEEHQNENDENNAVAGPTMAPQPSEQSKKRKLVDKEEENEAKKVCMPIANDRISICLLCGDYVLGSHALVDYCFSEHMCDGQLKNWQKFGTCMSLISNAMISNNAVSVQHTGPTLPPPLPPPPPPLTPVQMPPATMLIQPVKLSMEPPSAKSVSLLDELRKRLR